MFDIILYSSKRFQSVVYRKDTRRFDGSYTPAKKKKIADTADERAALLYELSFEDGIYLY